MKDAAWGTEEKVYGYLKPYLEELARVNPGSHFFHEQDSDGRFIRCRFTVPFLAEFLSNAVPAQIHDMAHLRDQKYPGQLSHMVVQDGNHNILGLPGVFTKLRMKRSGLHSWTATDKCCMAENFQCSIYFLWGHR